MPAPKRPPQLNDGVAGVPPNDGLKARPVDDVDVGVVRAAFGVAETGSVLLTEAEMKVEAIGFLPQHLVVLLDPERVVATLHDGYADALESGINLLYCRESMWAEKKMASPSTPCTPAGLIRPA